MTTSEIITLSEPLYSDCAEAGDTVVIETKKNIVYGTIVSINTDKTKLTVSYDSVETGYGEDYVLSGCEIKAIRCPSCCDDRYTELSSCGLTTEKINAAYGDVLPPGKNHLYFGDVNQPDCVYTYLGTGDFTNPDNWIDETNDIAGTLANLTSEQEIAFLTWIANNFSGDGISFNVDSETGVITVTVTGGGASGASSFTATYNGGTITHDPNDGSGPTDYTVIEVGEGLPESPYNWFLYMNSTNNAVYMNVEGTALLFGVLDDENIEPNTCLDVVNCVINNLEAGIKYDTYYFPEVDGPWQIDQVVYGNPSSVAILSGCPGVDLDTLVDALNDCANNPENWIWKNVDGVLTLCVPVGTNITSVTYGDGEGIINEFNESNFVAGGVEPSVCLAISECLEDIGGILKPSENNTEEEIEDEFSNVTNLIVSWIDGDGDERLSYKRLFDSGSSWYHPVEKIFDSAPEAVSFVSNASGTGNIGSFTIDYISEGVPSDAKYVGLRIRVKGTSTGTAFSSFVGAPYDGTLLNPLMAEVEVVANGEAISNAHGYVRVGAGNIQGEKSIHGSANGSTSVQVFITGWKR